MSLFIILCVHPAVAQSVCVNTVMRPHAMGASTLQTQAAMLHISTRLCSPLSPSRLGRAGIQLSGITFTRGLSVSTFSRASGGRRFAASRGLFSCTEGAGVKETALRRPEEAKVSTTQILQTQMSQTGASKPSQVSATKNSISTSDGEPLHVIVCGGGVIGSCTAYFLGKKGARVTVVEKTELACAASGKAGGFLALDWCDGSRVEGLARASFALHEKLAEELGGEILYGYRRVDTLSVSVEEPRDVKGLQGRGPKAGSPAWIDGSLKGTPSTIGSPTTNAQVHPQLFTRAIFAEAKQRYGASLVIGEVQEIKVEEKRVTGVVVDGNYFAADAVVLAMGPWSNRIPLISDLTSISGLKAHSIVLRPRNTDAISAHMLFLKYRTREGKLLDPEIYPRATGEIYVCGMSEEVAVPEDARQILPRDESITMLQRIAGTVSSHLEDAELEVAQACFLPCSEDNVPVIGKLSNLEGAYVATGHSCWGILNAPATGAALAELIVDGVPKIVDLKPFDPSRFVRIGSRRR